MPEAPDPIPISALQHWSYCPRQCGLIHLEQAFDENLHTLRGQAVHRQVDMPGFEARAGVRIERALPLWHDELGLSGRADVVEFLADGTPYPVEYKHGRRRERAHDDLQLAAQAMCLEFMTGRAVPAGALFYASSRRRREVEVTAELRRQVVTTIAEIRAMMESGHLPPAVNDKRCKECSLQDRCQPAVVTAAALQAELRRHLFDPD